MQFLYCSLVKAAFISTHMYRCVCVCKLSVGKICVFCVNELLEQSPCFHFSLHPWLLPGANFFLRKFLSDIVYAKEETTINGTRLSFTDFPERSDILSLGNGYTNPLSFILHNTMIICLSYSVHMSRDFRKIGPLVQHVPLIGAKTSLVAPTFHGSRFMHILMVGISANHSNRISWDGEFSEENIMIIGHKSKSNRVDTRDSSHYEVRTAEKKFQSVHLLT